MAETLTSMTGFLRRRRRRSWILLLAGAGISGYGVYTLYHLPEVERRRRKLLALLKTLVSFADAVSSSTETVALLTSDLNSFLRSNSDEVPASLKQLSKLARSDEFAASISRVSEALTLGVVRGIGSGPVNSASSTSNLSDRVVDKVFSPSGTGFASVVVGSFARNLAVAVGFMHQEPDSPTPRPAWMEMIGSDRCRDLAANCIEKFVSTLVSVYLEKTKGINSFDELFAGITNPKHEAKAKDFVVSVCNGAVETLIRASHQAISGSNRVQEENGYVGKNGVDEEENGWFDKVSSTLAVPSNRRLVLDVTGRVTFETVRSFLDFTLWKICVGAKRGARVVGDGVAERGMEVVRYFSAKSMLVVTICLAMCMRVMAGTRVLMPA